MAEVIQFNCPVCETTLRLPLTMAAERGPCPKCNREIIAPDPARGVGAREAPLPPPPKAIEPSRPVSEKPPTVKSQRAVLVLSCLFCGVVALALGFVLGVQTTKRSMSLQPATTPAEPTQPEPPLEPDPPEPEPIPFHVKPTVEEAPIKPPVIEPTPDAAAAEAALKAFLEAPDWASRSAHVLFPETTRAAMKAYSRESPDGPTPFKSISVKQTQIDEKTGYTLFIFLVSTEAYPSGIPVPIQETKGGWRVDWQTFVEFRDQLFHKFTNGPAQKTGRFHLIVSPAPPAPSAKPGNEHFISVQLNAPLNGTPQLAFVKRASGTFASLRATTTDAGFFMPVLEVAKRKTPDGKTYLEVLRVVATDWIPRVP